LISEFIPQTGEIILRLKTKYPHIKHSCCIFNENQIVISGNHRVSSHPNDGKTCELYDSQLDRIRDLPYMNTGRYFHSSCSFNNQYVYIFGGIDQSDLR
jgi:hypothetical protein